MQKLPSMQKVIDNCYHFIKFGTQLMFAKACHSVLENELISEQVYPTEPRYNN